MPPFAPTQRPDINERWIAQPITTEGWTGISCAETLQLAMRYCRWVRNEDGDDENDVRWMNAERKDGGQWTMKEREGIRGVPSSESLETFTLQLIPQHKTKHLQLSPSPPARSRQTVRDNFEILPSAAGLSTRAGETAAARAFANYSYFRSRSGQRLLQAGMCAEGLTESTASGIWNTSALRFGFREERAIHACVRSVRTYLMLVASPHTRPKTLAIAYAPFCDRTRKDGTFTCIGYLTCPLPSQWTPARARI